MGIGSTDEIAMTGMASTERDGSRTAPAPFLRNSWYVAGYASELEQGRLLARTFLGEPVVMFRTAAGELAAVQDRCPHRFAPLSKGRLEGEGVRCIYHGLAFDRSGKCFDNPHGPAGALAVKAYPLAERAGLLWVWMGTQDEADESRIPTFDHLDPAADHVRTGYLHGCAHYELMSDNILDLSHIEFLHPMIGTSAVRQAKVKVEQLDDHVVVQRAMRNETLPANLAHVYRTGPRPVNRTLQVTWLAPANLILDVAIETADDGEPWSSGSQSLHLFTPETERSTHYFYVASLERDKADAETADRFADALGHVFATEDKPIIDAQAANIGFGDFETLKPALLAIDKGPVLARRRLKQLIEAERAAQRGEDR